MAAEPAPVSPNAPDRARRLAEVVATGKVKPVVLAGERRLAVPGPLGGLIPAGGLQRGVVVAVDGPPGSGAATLVHGLLAAATAAGEWAAVVDPEETFGALAAAEAGVALERLAVLRPGAQGCSAGLWSRVVSLLLEGATVVAAPVPVGLRVGDVRRLVARARERSSVLVATGGWPGEAALRLRAESSAWPGLGRGEGLLGGRRMVVEVSGRGAAGRGRTAELAFAGLGPWWAGEEADAVLADAGRRAS